jgi:hypothetical protein
MILIPSAPKLRIPIRIHFELWPILSLRRWALEKIGVLFSPFELTKIEFLSNTFEFFV